MHVALILRWCLCISPFRPPLLPSLLSFSLPRFLAPFVCARSLRLSLRFRALARFLTREPLALFKRRTRRDEIGGGEGTGRLDSPLFRLTLNFRYSYAILSTPALCHLLPFPARSPSPTSLYHSSFAQPSTLSPSFS